LGRGVPRVLLFAVFMFAITAAFGPGCGAAEPIVLRAVTAWPGNTPDNIPFQLFSQTVAKMVAQKYPGGLRIDYAGGPETIKTQDQMQALQRGAVDICYTTNAYYVSLLPEADAMKLSEFTPMEERTRGVTTYWNDLHEKKLKVHYLGRLGHDMRFHLYLTKRIKGADLKGLNIRVSPMYVQVIRGLGGNPVVMPPAELQRALERNIVDGYCWVSVGIRDWGWHKATKYIVEPGFYRGPNPILVNLAAWNRLPKKFQDLLTAAAVESEKKAVAYFESMARKERPLLSREGVQVIDLPPAERERFLKVAYDEGWKDVFQKSPWTAPELKKLLTKEK